MGNIKQSISWNMISFLVVGISGILINVIIGKFYGTEALGVFNLIFAVYIFFSQLAVFGIHLSTLKYVSEHAHSKDLSSIIISALVAVSFIAGIITIFSLIVGSSLGALFHSDAVARSWQYIAYGLFFFALNKTLFSVINGMEHMRFFAVVQALRYIFALCIISVFLLYHIPSFKLGLIISLSEILLFIILLPYVFVHLSTPTPSFMSWVKKHLLFGYHSFWGATIGELNTRVDTLILGVFVSDSLVGVYTLALMIFEGFVQIGVVLRNIFNPKLSKLISAGNFEQLTLTIKKIKKNTYIVFTLLSLVGIILFPYFVNILFGKEFEQSILIYYILISSILITSGYLPFDMILSQAGFPKFQSYYRTNIVMINIVFNFILIPFWGVYGAAFATVLAFSSRIYLLNKYACKAIGIRI